MPRRRGKSNRADGLGRAHPCWPAGRRRSRVSRVTDPGLASGCLELASVSELDCATVADATAALRPCCAAVRWVSQLVAGRPYRTLAALVTASDAAIAALTWPDIEEALAAHPRIGDRPAAPGPGSRLVPAGAGRHQRRRAGRPGRAALGQRRLRGAVRARVPDLRDRPADQRHADRAARADGPRSGHRARNRPGRTRQDRRAPAGQGVRPTGRRHHDASQPMY